MFLLVVLKEGAENARVGNDRFAANLLGKIDHIEVAGLNRWVRQGQKLVTIKSGGETFELVSPVEGVVKAVNKDVVEDPGVIGRDPYQGGWIAMVKSPDNILNKKNLVQGQHGGAVAAEQRDAVERNGHSAGADHGG